MSHYLPQTELWYLHPTKQRYSRQFSGPLQLFLGDKHPPMFVRGGSILTMLDLPPRGDFRSLLQIYPRLEINLELYLDASNQAEGLLYFDDGLTLNHQQAREKAFVAFSFDSGVLRATRLISETMSRFEQPLTIKAIEIYGHTGGEKPMLIELMDGQVVEPEEVEVNTWDGQGKAGEWENLRVKDADIKLAYEDMPFLMPVPIMTICYKDCQKSK